MVAVFRSFYRSRRTRSLLVVATVALLAGPTTTKVAHAAAPRHVDAAPDESFNEYVPGAAGLEGSLLAPCCWDDSRQTLDIHGSPIANELRREIRHRLKAGETPDAVKADLVRRYTTKILAVPPGNPLPHMGTVLSIALLCAGVFAGSRVAKWRRRSTETRALGPDAVAGAPADEWDERLNAELEEKD